jgi:hypothetical protein
MLYLVAKPYHVGPMWTGPACRLHYPTSCGWQTRGQSPLTDTILHYFAAKLLLKVSLPTLVHTLLLSGKETKFLIGAALSNHFEQGSADCIPLSSNRERPPECSALV